MHFSVLVTGQRFSEGVFALRALGLTTAFAPFDTIIGTLRRGSTFDFAADVILVDGTTGNPMLSEGTASAWRAAQAISGLSDMYVMPSGVRWNAAPKVVIGEHAGLGASLLQIADGKLDYLTPYDAMELGRGPNFWLRVYHRLKAKHLAFAPILADSMRSLGVVLTEQHGQVLRSALRPGVRRKDLESALYAGTADRYFDARSEAMRRILSVLASGPDAAARAIEELLRVCRDPAACEAVPEALTHLNPYLFDVAPHEAIAQRSLTLPDRSALRLDMLRRETGVAGRPGPEIFEFKRGGHRQMQGYGLAQFEYLGAEQVEYYHEALSKNNELALRRLQSSFIGARKRVVGGFIGDTNRDRLKKLRARFPDINIEGWDEVAHRNLARFGISGYSDADVEIAL